MDLIWSWIVENRVETMAAALGLLAIALQIKQNVWYWLVSIVMVSMYIFVYIQAKLYADMSLQVYYLIISFYGWYMWLFGNKSHDSQKALPVSRSSVKLLLTLLGIAVALFFLIAFILVRFSDSDVPYWDAFTTALSFVATWMLARKILENWLVWIVVDAVSVGIYIYKELYPTTVLFTVLTILAVFGYFHWKKDLKKEQFD